jgi:excinuclease ABC subunit C
LEANLIKKHQPKFNVVWRDDKNYFYVAIVQNTQKIPYIYITHQPTKQQLTTNRLTANNENPKLNVRSQKLEVMYIGPFVEGTALKKTLKFLRKVFPYYTGPKHPKNNCTWCHLELCPGPAPDLKKYKKDIKNLILIIKGKKRTVLNSLKKEMNGFSKENKFEEAERVRDTISNLQQVMAHSMVIGQSEITNISDARTILAKIIGLNKPISKIECYDISNIQGKFATGSMVTFIDGKSDKSQYKKFKINPPAGGENTPNDIAMLKEILIRRFAHTEWKYPEVILIDGGIAQLNIAIKVKQQKLETRNIKVLSLAKHNNDLYIEQPKGYPKKFIPLKSLTREIYNLILQLDQEAHRFAITYHKKLRKKGLLH